jgi:hypothetical protein
MAVWSEVIFSEIPDDLRFDAEYYQPEYLSQVDTITKSSFKTVEELADVSDGNHLSISENFCESGIRYLRGQDLKDFFIMQILYTSLRVNMTKFDVLTCFLVTYLLVLWEQ